MAFSTPWARNCARTNSKNRPMDEIERRGRHDIHGETDIIRNIFAPLAKEVEGAFGLIDDAALVTAAPGEELVLTADMLVAGVHFLPRGAPADTGYKALGVNVSDLIAKGADPAGYLLSIALSGKPDIAWLNGLKEGLAEAQADFGCLLTGGDTVSTPGPLCLSVTAFGRIPTGKMVMRSGARPGDRVYVTGTIGDAAAGLKILQSRPDGAGDALGEADRAFLLSRYRRPRPQPVLAPILRAHASGAMDISDGLAGDFAKLCAASECGGAIDAARVPLSGPAQKAMDAGVVSLEELLCGGDDYEVLASVPDDHCAAFEKEVNAAGLRTVKIGMIDDGKQASVVDETGNRMLFSRPGFDHF